MSQNSLRLSWSAEEVDEKLKELCLLFTLHVEYGKDLVMLTT
jgi:glutamate dehydrogenase/leucine dehydrogenase